MDSERRHELKQNDLDAGLAGLPGFFKRHGSKLLLVVAFALLAVVVVRYRTNQAAQREQNVYSSLATANNAVAQLQRTELMYVQRQMQIAEFKKMPQWATLGDAEKAQIGGGGNPALLVAARGQAENEVRAGVQGVIDNADPADHAAALAGAWTAQGELYWQLATAMPVQTTATTQPATQPTDAAAPTTQKSPVEYLSLSKQAYEHVLKNFPQQPRSLAAARMSLAAIAETESDFAAARTHYQAVIDAADAPAMEKSVAATRISQLDDLAKPTLLAPPLPPATQPTTQPAAAEPLPGLGSMPMLPNLGAPAPTTAPTTQP